MRITTSVSILIVLGLVSACPTLFAQSTETLSFDTGRPLFDTINALQKRFGWVISYEDPEYACSADLEDRRPEIAARQHRAVDPGDAPFWGPRYGSFRFSYQVTDGKPVEDPVTLLRRLVKEYGESKPMLPVFEVRQREDKLLVLPIKVRNNKCELVDFTPYLDNVISLTEQKRSPNQIMNDFGDELRRVTGHKLHRGGVVGYFDRPELAYGAASKPARDILEELFERMRRHNRTSYALLYNPSAGYYVLNVHTTPLPPQGNSVKPN